MFAKDAGGSAAAVPQKVTEATLESTAGETLAKAAAGYDCEDMVRHGLQTSLKNSSIHIGSFATSKFISYAGQFSDHRKRCAWLFAQKELHQGKPIKRVTHVYIPPQAGMFGSAFDYDKEAMLFGEAIGKERVGWMCIHPRSDQLEGLSTQELHYVASQQAAYSPL